jgi:hypothetical protein
MVNPPLLATEVVAYQPVENLDHHPMAFTTSSVDRTAFAINPKLTSADV